MLDRNNPPERRRLLKGLAAGLGLLAMSPEAALGRSLLVRPFLDEGGGGGGDTCTSSSLVTNSKTGTHSVYYQVPGTQSWTGVSPSAGQGTQAGTTPTPYITFSHGSWTFQAGEPVGNPPQTVVVTQSQQRKYNPQVPGKSYTVSFQGNSYTQTVSANNPSVSGSHSLTSSYTMTITVECDEPPDGPGDGMFSVDGLASAPTIDLPVPLEDPSTRAGGVPFELDLG